MSDYERVKYANKDEMLTKCVFWHEESVQSKSLQTEQLQQIKPYYLCNQKTLITKLVTKHTKQNKRNTKTNLQFTTEINSLTPKHRKNNLNIFSSFPPCLFPTWMGTHTCRGSVSAPLIRDSRRTNPHYSYRVENLLWHKPPPVMFSFSIEVIFLEWNY